jgi:translation initiation factor IF-3
LIDENGEQLGVKSLDEAIALAQERGFDLVEISSAVNPPVCKISDFSKFKYERDKKLKEAKKKNKVIHLKEIRIRPKISPHDLQIKLNYIKGFLEEQDKVRVSIIFQGREMQHQERGNEILKLIMEQLGDMAEFEKASKMEGNRLLVTLVPKSK